MDFYQILYADKINDSLSSYCKIKLINATIFELFLLRHTTGHFLEYTSEYIFFLVCIVFLLNEVIIWDVPNSSIS